MKIQKRVVARFVPLCAALFATFAAGAVEADEALAKAKLCTGCHGVDKKIVGPAYKDVAAKYAGQKDAEATLTNAIQKGSKDVFGPVPMPPNPGVTPAEAAKLAKWVLSLK